MLLRLAAAAAATAFIVMSLRYLPLATVDLVLQVTPLAVTPGAAILYGESVGWRRWLAALAGFLGVVLIVKPGGGFGAAAYIAADGAALHDHARSHHARPAPRHSLHLRGCRQRGRHHAGRRAARPFDGAWTCRRPGPGA